MKFKAKKDPILIKKQSRLQFISVLMIFLCLIAQIQCQATTQTLDGSQRQIASPSLRPDSSEFVSTGDQLAPNCFQKCEGLSFYFCSICYKQCEYANGTTFDMKTCEFKACTWWDIFPYSEDNPTSTFTRCTQWEVRLLPQQQCIGNCCGAEADYTYFTPENMQKCVDANVQQSQSDSTVIAIVAGSLSGLFLLIIFLVIFCWCRHQVIVCFKNILYFFQGLCPCVNKEQKSKRKKESTNDSSDDSKKSSKLMRTRRKWQNLPKKIQASQLPTSKYIIESQYEINPQIYCSVCLDDELNCETACKHRYHFQCLRQNMLKKMKCPQCTSKSFNPLKVICELCQQKYTSYSLNKKNVQEKYPDFYYEGKIYCNQCLQSRQNRRRRRQ